MTAKPITTMAEFETQMMYMISQEGPLGNMVASGDAHSATQLIGSLSSLLDNLASNTSSSPNQDEINDLRSIDTEKMAPEEIQVIEMKIKGLEEAESIRKANETLIRVKVRASSNSRCFSLFLRLHFSRKSFKMHPSTYYYGGLPKKGPPSKMAYLVYNEFK